MVIYHGKKDLRWDAGLSVKHSSVVKECVLILIQVEGILVQEQTIGTN